MDLRVAHLHAVLTAADLDAVVGCGGGGGSRGGRVKSFNESGIAVFL